MGEEVAHLVHQIDAQIGVFDPGMDMHAANHHAAGDHPEVLGHDLVAILVGGLLLPPQREGVGGGGHDRGAVLLERIVQRCPHLGQLLTGLRHARVHPGRDLELGT